MAWMQRFKLVKSCGCWAEIAKSSKLEQRVRLCVTNMNWTQIVLHKLNSISAENYLTLHVPRNFVFLSAKDCYSQYKLGGS